MMKKAISAAAAMLLAGNAVAGGVTIHNYSGEPVMAIVGSFEILSACFMATNIIDGTHCAFRRT